MKSLIEIDKYYTAWNTYLNRPCTGDTAPTVWHSIAVNMSCALLGEDSIETSAVSDAWKHFCLLLFTRIASFEPLYDITTEAGQTKMDLLFSSWSSAHAAEITKIMKAYNTTYDPLENYHRTGYKQEILDGASSVDNTTTAHVAPDSAETFYNTGKSVVDMDTTTDNTTTINTEDRGNVGVTTSQQMLQAEIDLRMQGIFDRVFIMPVVNVLSIAVY